MRKTSRHLVDTAFTDLGTGLVLEVAAKSCAVTVRVLNIEETSIRDSKHLAGLMRQAADMMVTPRAYCH